MSRNAREACYSQGKIAFFNISQVKDLIFDYCGNMFEICSLHLLFVLF